MLTEEQIASKIKAAEYFYTPPLTACVLTLENGFKVTGTSACIDPDDYRVAVGEGIAYRNAVEKIWELEGYLAKEQLYLEETHSVANGELTFGDALCLLKDGYRVARTGWNGKGMWLSLSPGTPGLPAEKFWSPHNRAFAERSGGSVDVLPSIGMKTADGKVLMGWLASQTDMLAEDWYFLEDEA